MSDKKRTQEPREAALSQVERNTSGQQERVHKVAAREKQEARARGAKLLKDDLKASSPDQRSQAEKFADAAREHGADENEAAFKKVLRKLTKRNEG